MREAAVVSQSNPLQRIPGVAIVLVLLIAVFGAIAPGFLSVANLSNVLVQSTILTMLALPMTLIIMTEGLDLSMGAVLTLTSLCVAIVSLATHSMLLGLGAGLLVGAAFGTINGWLVAILGIPPFVATLGTLGMAQGLSLIVSDGQSVVGIPHSVRDIYSATLLGIPVPIVMALVTYAAFHGLLYHTRFGTYIFAPSAATGRRCAMPASRRTGC
ncbi:ribose/xylose/arabinose/galactoside ABC-type transport system permease subunit [Bradyrhizobium sp. LM3.2]